MLTVYSPSCSNRVKYTFNLVFNSILKISFKTVSDIDSFRNCIGAKISYAPAPIEDEIFFRSSILLFETGVKNPPPFRINREGEPEKDEDIFAIIFFLVSRYEEYLPFTPDRYGRFSAKHSFAFKNNFLHKPVVNILAEKIRKILTERYPDFIFPKRTYTYTPTLDIDNAYAYLGKNLVRTLGGYAKALARYDTGDLTKRTNVLLGKEKDPYDTYDFQMALHKKHTLKPIYFFLLGDWAPFDKNIPHTNPRMRGLVNTLSENADVGIHPSFASNQYPAKIKTEKTRLENIKNEPVTKSRQHFLMLRFPATYRNAIASGITEDYTMGFADEIGFRAGICTAFAFYDLLKEEETSLVVHPFAVMDGTLNNYLKVSPREAINKIAVLVKEIKNVNGEFISIWHNETLSEWKDWKGWRIVYEEMVKVATSPSNPSREGEIFK
jgi:hypothetical protein